jgi:short-subunit dehydrogenase
MTSPKRPIHAVSIFGATSAIAIATARLLAVQGSRFFLVARDKERLNLVADDLRARGASSVDTITADLDDTSSIESFVEKIFATLGTVDLTLVAHGILGDQLLAERIPSSAVSVLWTDFVSAATLVGALANHFERQRSGTLAVITSVAGDRGRRSNYIYGSAKGGLSLFVSGVRSRLHASGVHVLTIKPGLVSTPMTAHLAKNALFSSPECIAERILSGVLSRRDVVYAPNYWRLVMAAIRAVPETLFKRLKL